MNGARSGLQIPLTQNHQPKRAVVVRDKAGRQGDWTAGSLLGVVETASRLPTLQHGSQPGPASVAATGKDEGGWPLRGSPPSLPVNVARRVSRRAHCLASKGLDLGHCLCQPAHLSPLRSPASLVFISSSRPLTLTLACCPVRVAGFLLASPAPPSAVRLTLSRSFQLAVLVDPFAGPLVAPSLALAASPYSPSDSQPYPSCAPLFSSSSPPSSLVQPPPAPTTTASLAPTSARSVPGASSSVRRS